MVKIPEGWKCAPLDDVAAIQTGVAKGKAYSGKTIRVPYLRVANVQDGYLDLSEIKEIEVLPSEVERYRLQFEDVLLTEGGDFDKLGRGDIWRGELPLCLHQNHIFVVRTNRQFLDPYFFTYQTSSPYGKQYFLASSKQSTNLASINSSQLREFPVLLPPLAEQRQIAAILSTWDEAITHTTQLIAALQRRKQALMQLLLTGAVRFPGFDDEWQSATLGEKFQRITRTSASAVEKVLSITAGVGFVDQGSKFGRVIAGKNLERYIHLNKGEFAYNKGNSTRYPQGCIYRLEEFESGAVPNVYYCFSPSSEEIYGEFYKYYFESGKLNEELRPLINSGVRNDGLLNLSADAFFGMEVSIPSFNEQKCLAEFFDVITTEIKLQSQELEQLQTQKRGLMQQLLTGVVRVPLA